MSKTVIIKICPPEADVMQEFLDGEGVEGGDTLRTYTADLGDGIEVDIKVCEGSPPFVDAILYDNNEAVSLLEPTDELLGEYIFFYDGQAYTVILEEGDEHEN